MSSMYSLTAMTGKEAAATRTVVIGTVEFNYRVWIILICSSFPGLMFVFLFWTLLGQYAIFALPATWAGAVFLLHRRQRDGLRLRTYQGMWDKRRAATNQFFLCGQPIQVGTTDYRAVTPNSVAYVPEAPASSDSLVDVLSAVPLAPGIVPAAALDRPVTVPAPEPQPPAPVEMPVQAPVHEAPAPVAPPVAPAVAPTPVVPAAPDPLDDPRYFAGYVAGIRTTQVAEPPIPTPQETPGVDPLDRLDASLIGVERPDPLSVDVSALLDDQPDHPRALFGRAKDHS